MAKKKSEVVEIVEIQLDELVELPLEVEPTNELEPEPIVLDAAFSKKIARDPDQLIEWEQPKEPLQELPLEVVEDEPPVVEGPVLEAVEPTDAMGQGSWHQKYNAARRGKSAAVRRYTPVHRQR